MSDKLPFNVVSYQGVFYVAIRIYIRDTQCVTYTKNFQFFVITVLSLACDGEYAMFACNRSPPTYVGPIALSSPYAHVFPRLSVGHVAYVGCPVDGTSSCVAMSFFCTMNTLGMSEHTPFPLYATVFS